MHCLLLSSTGPDRMWVSQVSVGITPTPSAYRCRLKPRSGRSLTTSTPKPTASTPSSPRKRRMIELLEERRRVELTTAIFTDRSTAWGAIRHVVDLLPGYAFPSASFADVGIRLLRGANIAPGRLRWDEDVVRLAPAERQGLSDYELAEGDLVIGMDRPFIGSGVRIAPVTAADLTCLLVQRVGSHTCYRTC